MLPRDVLVHARHGLINIQDISPGIDVLTSGGYRRVIDVNKGGWKFMMNITTKTGEFSCDSDSLLAVIGVEGDYGWRSAKLLMPGDRLINSGVSIQGSHTTLPACIIENIMIPDLDVDMAWLMGLLSCSWRGRAANNTAPSGYRISQVGLERTVLPVAKKASDQLKRFGSNLDLLISFCKNYPVASIEKKRTLKKFFKNLMVSTPPKQHAPIYHKLFDVDCANDTDVIRYFEEINVYSASAVPDWINCATLEIKLAFIAGVMDKHRHRIVDTDYLTVHRGSRKFVRSLQILAFSCGLSTRTSSASNHEILLTADERSTQILLALTTSMAKAQLYRTRVNSRCWSINNNVRDDMDPFSGTSEVIDIELGDKKESVYGITVEDRHEFFCNGYLCKDSAG
jgi:hypothetical protein